MNRHLGPTEAEHDPGLVVLILGINRLLAPGPLVHVEDWLDGIALLEALGLSRSTRRRGQFPQGDNQ